METLIVGILALGIVAVRLRALGVPVRVATRNAESAARLKASGLRVTGVGGSLTIEVSQVAVVDEYSTRDTFDLVVLATKAAEAIEVALRLLELLGPGGTLAPIQNGGVPQMLAGRLGDNRVLGGLSNLGATMTVPGVYEQRNAGHLLIGEAGGGEEVV
jgi:2-dehydropantoate 2-reductase